MVPAYPATRSAGGWRTHRPRPVWGAFRESRVADPRWLGCRRTCGCIGGALQSRPGQNLDAAGRTTGSARTLLRRLRRDPGWAGNSSLVFVVGGAACSKCAAVILAIEKTGTLATISARAASGCLGRALPRRVQSRDYGRPATSPPHGSRMRLATTRSTSQSQHRPR